MGGGEITSCSITNAKVITLISPQKHTFLKSYCLEPLQTYKHITDINTSQPFLYQTFGTSFTWYWQMNPSSTCCSQEARVCQGFRNTAQIWAPDFDFSSESASGSTQAHTCLLTTEGSKPKEESGSSATSQNTHSGWQMQPPTVGKQKKKNRSRKNICLTFIKVFFWAFPSPQSYYLKGWEEFIKGIDCVLLCSSHETATYSIKHWDFALSAFLIRSKGVRKRDPEFGSYLHHWFSL